MNTMLTWQEGIHFRAEGDSQYPVLIDGPEELGGENRGARPMELLLMGIGGCAAVDVLHILKKSRQSVSCCNVSVKAERANSDPKVFTKIHLIFTLSGNDLDHRKVARAVSLSAEKYCSASILMQRAGVELTHEILLEAA